MDMFDDLRFERQLRRARQSQRKEDARSNKLIKKAREEKRTEDVERLLQDAHFEWSMAQEHIESLVTQYVTDKARTLLIPLPDSSAWETMSITGVRVLNPEVVKKLRDDIHDEVKKRWERRFIWLTPLSTLVGMLTGLIGATIGLVTLLHLLK